jgi:hypothetical protein
MIPPCTHQAFTATPFLVPHCVGGDGYVTYCVRFCEGGQTVDLQRSADPSERCWMVHVLCV